jgi:hypothetical protein
LFIYSKSLLIFFRHENEGRKERKNPEYKFARIDLIVAP